MALSVFYAGWDETLAVAALFAGAITVMLTVTEEARLTVLGIQGRDRRSEFGARRWHARQFVGGVTGMSVVSLVLVYLPLLAFRKLRARSRTERVPTGLMPSASGLAFGLFCAAVAIGALLAIRQLDPLWLPSAVGSWLGRLEPTLIRTDAQYRADHQVDLMIAAATACVLALATSAGCFLFSRDGRRSVNNYMARRGRRRRAAKRAAQLDADRLRGPYRRR